MNSRKNTNNINFILLPQPNEDKTQIKNPPRRHSNNRIILNFFASHRPTSPIPSITHVLPFLLFDFAGNILDENGKEACLNVETGRIHPDSAIHPFIFPEIQPPRSLFFFFEED